MGARNSKGTFNRQAEARQSQKKTYQKFRQSNARLTKEVNKVKVQNKEKLLELEIAIKSAANDLEIAKTYTDPEYEDVFEDFLRKCEELDKIVKQKLDENDRNLERGELENARPQSVQNAEGVGDHQGDIATAVEGLLDENAMFAEAFPKPEAGDKKKKKKSKDDDSEGATKKDKKKKKGQGEASAVNSLLSEEENANQQTVSSKTDKKRDKKSKKTNEVGDNISRDTLDLDEPDKPSTSSNKRRFWSLSMRLKRKPSKTASVPETRDPIIIMQDPENEDRSLQNIEINQLEKAIKNNSKKDKTKRRSRVTSQFFDQQSDVPPTPSSSPVPAPRPEPCAGQQDSLQQIHNIRMSVSTLEEMTKIYKLSKRGNYDYIHDNLCLCVNKLQDMDHQDLNLAVLTLRHEKKLAMQQVQLCLDVLEGKLPLPEQYDGGRPDEGDRGSSEGGGPQIVIARTPSKKRNDYQRSVEFIDITNNDEVIDFAVQEDRESAANTDGGELGKVSRDSADDFSEDDDLRDILMNLQDSTEDVALGTSDPNKPVLITSF